MKQEFHILFDQPEISQLLIGGVELVFPYTCRSILADADSKQVPLEAYAYRLFVRVSDRMLNRVEDPQWVWSEQESFSQLCRIIFPQVKNHIRERLTANSLADGEAIAIFPEEGLSGSSDLSQKVEMPAGASMLIDRSLPSLIY